MKKETTLYDKSRDEVQQGALLLEEIHPHIDRKWFARPNGKVITQCYINTSHYMDGGFIEYFKGSVSHEQAEYHENKAPKVKIFEIFPETQELTDPKGGIPEKYGGKRKVSKKEEEIGGIPIFNLVKHFEMIGEGVKTINHNTNWGKFRMETPIYSGGKKGFYGSTPTKRAGHVMYLEDPKDALIGGGLYLLSMDFSLISPEGIRVHYDYDKVSLDDVTFSLRNMSGRGIETFVLREKDKREKEKLEDKRESTRFLVLNSMSLCDLDSLRNIVQYLEGIRPSGKKQELLDLINKETEDLSLEELSELRSIFEKMIPINFNKSCFKMFQEII